MQPKTHLPEEGDFFVRVHAGAGGEESVDWAQILAMMYVRWAGRTDRKAHIVYETDTRSDALFEITHLINNYDPRLRGEDGVHRLVRFSPFDEQRRRHTSFARVDILPVPGEGADYIKRNVSTTAHRRQPDPASTMLTITEASLPEKSIRVFCDGWKSVKDSLLVARTLLAAHVARMESGRAAAADQIRSYVFDPYQMVKDLRSGVEADPDDVLDGNLEAMLEGWRLWAWGKNAPKQNCPDREEPV